MTEPNLTPNGVAEIVAVTRDAVHPTPVDATKFYATASYREILDLEKFLPAPRRKTGIVAHSTVDSLVSYAQEHEDVDGTTLWVSIEAERVTAVLNDHRATEAAFGDHRAVVKLEHTDAWKHWTSLDGHHMQQEAFAEHIEQGLPEIVTPDGADLLELAQSFHATTAATFRSSQRLSSGEVQFQYDEETTASAGRDGRLEVPTSFELLLPVYVGEPAMALTARLKYRLREGKLSLGYQLVRPRDVVRDTLDLIAERLRGEFARVYLGTPR